jgi:hypothetical protein
LGRIAESASSYRNLGCHCQCADMIGLEQGHVFQRQQRGVSIAEGSENPGAFPVQFYEFVNVIANIQPCLNQHKQARPIIFVANSAK